MLDELPELGNQPDDPAPGRRGEGQERAPARRPRRSTARSTKRTRAIARSPPRSSISTRTRTGSTSRSRCSARSSTATPTTPRSPSASCSTSRGPDGSPRPRPRARDLVAKRPENRGGQRLLATVLFERGSTEEGEKILRTMIEADPDDAQARRALASELTRERRFDEARAMYEEMARRAGDDPRTGGGEDGGRDRARVHRLSPEGLGGRAPDPRSAGAVRTASVHPRAARILLAADRDGEF